MLLNIKQSLNIAFVLTFVPYPFEIASKKQSVTSQVTVSFIFLSMSGSKIHSVQSSGSLQLWEEKYSIAIGFLRYCFLSNPKVPKRTLYVLNIR